ncbi:5437_t:CDS:2 [Cetraspora pellucida]|uniref:5437_t:CDS:1 n=1 Tax=Cetraspora pellucida TaxID=1433469 RepID=A0A9N9HZU9_9GLOM|nr:5437_t:CDS:2 [Cetraspora pellucida]
MGRNRYKWSIYFKILDELANKSNKAAICYTCLEALRTEAKKITNKANLCYNHLKFCPYFAQKYSFEELEKILQINNESNSESSEEDSDDDIVAAFKLVNPEIKLPSCHKLSESILKKEVNIMKEQFELIVKDDNTGITLIFDGWKNVVKQKIMGTVLITSKGKAIDLAIKDINVISVISDSAGENVKSRKELRLQYTNIVFLPCFAHQANLCVADIFKSSERYNEISNKAVKIIGCFNTSTYFLEKLRNQQMHLYNGKAYALTSPYAKKVPFDIAEIINDSMFWNDLKELDEILLLFCATLNKLQCKLACLYDIIHAYPLFILSWLLHPSYGLKKLNIHLNSLLAPILGKWVVYYYTNWFFIRPKSILLELEDFLANNSLFDTISFDQFHNDIIKYWLFIKRGTHKELANLALRLFGICINSASYKKVFEMSQLQGKIIQERKLKSIEKTAKQIHNSNILLPIVSNSEENYSSQESNSELDQVNDNKININIQWKEVVANWLILLRNEQFEKDLDLTKIDETVHPATSQEAK